MDGGGERKPGVLSGTPPSRQIDALELLLAQPQVMTQLVVERDRNLLSKVVGIPRVPLEVALKEEDTRRQLSRGGVGPLRKRRTHEQPQKLRIEGRVFIHQDRVGREVLEGDGDSSKMTAKLLGKPVSGADRVIVEGFSAQPHGATEPFGILVSGSR